MIGSSARFRVSTTPPRSAFSASSSGASGADRDGLRLRPELQRNVERGGLVRVELDASANQLRNPLDFGRQLILARVQEQKPVLAELVGLRAPTGWPSRRSGYSRALR